MCVCVGGGGGSCTSEDHACKLVASHYFRKHAVIKKGICKSL